MEWEEFEMERWQSEWENQVRYNLSESGVHPIQLKALISEDMLPDLLNQRLGYIQTNGSEELRSRIALMYPGAGIDNILVTTGSSEANLIVILAMLNRGDEVALMLPNYMQIWGVARGLGVEVKPFWLQEGDKWQLDLQGLKELVTPRTKMIIICSPNNPTGAVLAGDELDEICRIADKVGAWVLADEVYRGAEVEGEISPGLWGRYKRTLITCGFSKAYGLPGLRIGWIVGPADVIAKCWSYHDYTSICASTISDTLASIALSLPQRKKILERARGIVRGNLPVLKDLIAGHADSLSLTEPRAGAIAFVKYRLKINSTELAQRLLKEKSVLIVPGDHFGMDGYMRIGYGPEKEYLTAGLSLIHQLINEIKGKVTSKVHYEANGNI